MTTAASTPMTEEARRIPARLIAHQDTLEDYVETRIPPVAHEVPYPLAVVQDPARSSAPPELLAVEPAGGLVHFRQSLSNKAGNRKYW